MGQIVLHPLALTELRDAVAYYEEQSAGLGRRFFDEVELYLSRMARYPTSFSPRLAKVRRANLKIFPFNINYMIFEDGIGVIAIAHNRRQPGYWKDRVPRSSEKSEWMK